MSPAGSAVITKESQGPSVAIITSVYNEIAITICHTAPHTVAENYSIGDPSIFIDFLFEF